MEVESSLTMEVLIHLEKMMRAGIIISPPSQPATSPVVQSPQKSYVYRGIKNSTYPIKIKYFNGDTKIIHQKSDLRPDWVYEILETRVKNDPTYVKDGPLIARILKK